MKKALKMVTEKNDEWTKKNYKLQSIQLSSLFLLKRKRRGKPETEKICMCMQFAKKMFNWNDDNDDDDYKRNLRNKIETG